jgi:nucleotide-binding universal stress UspA family protein
MTFNKILVPCDSSTASDKALSNALKIAILSKVSERIHKKGDGVVTISLLHVLPEISMPPSFGSTILRRLSEKTGEKITFREYLKKYIKR